MLASKILLFLCEYEICGERVKIHDSAIPENLAKAKQI